MNLKILSLFVRDISAQSAKSRSDCGKAAGIIGIASNIVLFIIKLIIGILSSSISIMADAINNISDAGSSIITLVGFKLAEKPADDKHPYGHARIEYLTGFIVSLIITFLGFQFLKDSIISIAEKTESSYTLVTIVILIVSIAVKLWQASFYKTVGKHIDSSSLIATATDSRNDVLSTSAVLLGAVITYFTRINLDGYIGVLIALFIIYSGIRLVMETADPILGNAPEEELVQMINDKIMSYDGILGIHDLIVHSYGAGKCFVSVHCEVPANEDILKSHDIIDNIEFDFLNNDNIQLVIHMDPVVTDDENVNNLRELTREIVAKISERFGSPITMHDFRVVVGPTHTNLIFDIVVKYSLKADECDICAAIDKEIKALSSTYNTVINVDHSFTTE